MKKSALTFVALLSIPLVTLSEPRQDFCTNPVSSVDIFTCSKVHLSDSDRELNHVYKDLNTYIDNNYTSNPKTRSKLKQSIKHSQQTWIILRDANCDLETSGIEPTSQAFETTKNNCSSRQTEERSLYLLNLKEHIL